MSEPLTIGDIRRKLEIGRTSAYKLTKTPGFPPPLPTTQRGYRWDADAVEAFLATHNATEHEWGPDARPDADYVIDTPEGITVYPPLRAGDGWRAQWYDPDGRRRACRATSETNMARKLEPIQAQLIAASTGLSQTPADTAADRSQRQSTTSPHPTPATRAGKTPAPGKLPAQPHPMPKYSSKVPSHKAVSALASALERKPLSPWWFELMPYMSAYSGLHMGEIFALDLEHLGSHHNSRLISVEWKIIETRGQTIRGPVEGRKRRPTIYPEVTPTGYPLAAMMARRAAEAAAENTAGRNPLGLLFPAPRGGHLRKSNFINRYAIPAYEAAGWRTGGDQVSWAWSDLRRVFCITALNEWGLDIADVSLLAGDADVGLTLGAYSDQDTMLNRAFEMTERQ